MTKKDTKELLNDSFAEIAKTKAIDKITVREISENAGVTTQTFYNHFSDKYDLVFWRFRNRIDTIFDRYGKGIIDWGMAMEEFIQGYDNHARFIINAFKNMNGQDSYKDKTMIYLANKMINNIKILKGVEEIPTEYKFYIFFYSSGIIDVVDRWLKKENRESYKVVARYLCDCVPMKLMDYCGVNKVGHKKFTELLALTVDEC